MKKTYPFRAKHWSRTYDTIYTQFMTFSEGRTKDLFQQYLAYLYSEASKDMMDVEPATACVAPAEDVERMVSQGLIHLRIHPTNGN